MLWKPTWLLTSFSIQKGDRIEMHSYHGYSWKPWSGAHAFIFRKWRAIAYFDYYCILEKQGTSGRGGAQLRMGMSISLWRRGRKGWMSAPEMSELDHLQACRRWRMKEMEQLSIPVESENTAKTSEIWTKKEERMEHCLDK